MDDLVTWLRAQLDEDEVDSAAAGLIARHDPARVLREVAAKRALLDFCESAPAAAYPDFDGGYASALEEVIPYLALAYADRDGYRPEWAPDPSG